MNFSILYRGPLSSCNYACPYCPFAKRDETYDELETDRNDLRRFISWVERTTSCNFGILFTPWGEALIRSWYQEALISLTQLSHIRRAVIQTNLSCNLDWTRNCNKEKLALWCTYHPGESTRADFLKQCHTLSARNVRYSVGVVGLKENLHEATNLRNELPSNVYVWINAYKRDGPGYYSSDELAAYSALDSLFPVNNQYHASYGHSCRAGDTVFSVDGKGTMTRCHFIKEPIGNIYDPNWMMGLQKRPCTNEACGCHIGYVHLERLGLYEIFEDNVLERIPVSPLQVNIER